jgi:hypothetical protein
VAAASAAATRRRQHHAARAAALAQIHALAIGGARRVRGARRSALCIKRHPASAHGTSGMARGIAALAKSNSGESGGVGIERILLWRKSSAMASVCLEIEI